MDIKELVVGKEYLKTSAYGKPNQKVKVLSVEKGSHWRAQIIYTSEDCTKGMRTSMNTIECELYLHPL